jgi:mycothiol synthase
MTEGLPGGYVLRAPEPGDLDAVHAVVSAADAEDIGRPWLTPADIAREWRHPGFDLRRDAWVIEEGGTIVAAAWLVIQPGAAEVFVHPGARGRGLGTALREAVEARAREAITRATLKQYAIGTNDAARALLTAAGYTAEHRYTSMRLELGGPPAAPAVPAGIAVRPFLPGADDRAVYDLDCAAFADSHDFEPQPFDFWQAAEIGSESLCPAASPTAWDGDELAGFGLCQLRPGALGFVPILAVGAGHRGRGLGRALLLWSFGRLAELGATAVELGVEGANARARRLYESAGMRADYVADRYEKPLA